MSKSIFVEELTLKAVGKSNEDQPPLTAYCVVVDGKRSDPYFYRRQAEEAVAIALAEPEQSPAS